MDIKGIRYSGVLMHITSLPSEFGIGDFGEGAYAFASKLKSSGAVIWQMLPLGPTGYGNSPYALRSTFAGNELLISPTKLRKEGLLSDQDLIHPPFNDRKVEFDRVIGWKMPLLKKAAIQFIESEKDKRAYRAFLDREAYWIDDYALFMALYEKYNDARWHTIWDKKEGFRDPSAIKKAKKESKELIDIYKVLQFFFQRQFEELKGYVNSLGIKIVGDIPIFVGADSADSWSHLELLKTDEEGHYTAVSGVPPDNFSPTGQLWGNPVYDWKKHEEDGFAWWKERIKRLFELTDILRIDHFRGFDAYYEIPSRDKTAENGKWKKSPGRELFKEIEREYGALPIIAEDLGFMTKSVESLRRKNHFPGMKIAMFGFSRDRAGYFDSYNDFLPMNYTRDFVAYTGTHDNDTVRHWFDALSNEDKHMVREYLSSNDEEIVWNLIRAVMMSNADYAIIPMQDILELSGDARMNYPSTCNDINWTWRMLKDEFNDYRINRYKYYVRISGRNGLTYEEAEKKHLEEIKSLGY